MNFVTRIDAVANCAIVEDTTGYCDLRSCVQEHSTAV